jgi:hypothetical protein
MVAAKADLYLSFIGALEHLLKVSSGFFFERPAVLRKSNLDRM